MHQHKLQADLMESTLAEKAVRAHCEPVTRLCTKGGKQFPGLRYEDHCYLIKGDDPSPQH